MSETENIYKKRQILSSQIDLSKFNKKNFEKATDEEKKQQEVMGESSSFLKDGFRRLRKNHMAMASIIVLILLIVAIIVIPMIVPYSYSDMITVNGHRDGTAVNLPPMYYSQRELQYMQETGVRLFPHILGTDSLGRDYFIRVVYGTRVSLSVGVVSAVMVLIIGVIYGTISGYFGGKVDLIMMRIVDIIYSLPDMLIIILLSVVLNARLTPLIKGTVLAKLGGNMLAMFIVFALLYWVGMARLVRGQILFTESYLSFLGLGVNLPMTSLGSLANDARATITSAPYRLLVPALVIVIIVLALNLIGDGLRDAFDSKLN